MTTSRSASQSQCAGLPKVDPKQLKKRMVKKKAAKKETRKKG